MKPSFDNSKDLIQHHEDGSTTNTQIQKIPGKEKIKHRNKARGKNSSMKRFLRQQTSAENTKKEHKRMSKIDDSIKTINTQICKKTPTPLQQKPVSSALARFFNAKKPKPVRG